MVNTCDGILLNHKKEFNNSICSNMDGLGDYHAKWSKADRERQISSDSAYQRNLKMIQMNLFTKQKHIHRLRKGTYGYQCERGEGRINWDFGIYMFTLLNKFPFHE